MEEVEEIHYIHIQINENNLQELNGNIDFRKHKILTNNMIQFYLKMIIQEGITMNL